MNNPFQQLKKQFYKRVSSPYVPCKPGTNSRTALVEGKESPIEVYTGKSKSKPDLLDEYIKKGYKFSEARKREIQERTFAKPALRNLISMMVEKSRLDLFTNQ